MLTCIVTKLNIQKPYFACYKLGKYEDFKVKNVFFNMCHQTLGLQACELKKWWEEVYDMFEIDLQHVI